MIACVYLSDSDAGKATPSKEKEAPSPRQDGESTPKTWKWKEAEAKRKEEMARQKLESSAKSASGELAPVVSAAPATPAKPTAVGESSVISTPQTPLHDIDDEDGMRKEEARLARSLSKKGMNLRPGV